MSSPAKFIRTTAGDVSTEIWGPTNCHGHLVHNSEAHHADARYADFCLTIEQTKPELIDFKEHGGFAIVELSPMGLGRDPQAVADAAAAAGVHVVIGSGIYHEAFHPAEIAEPGEADICELLIREITEGIGSTGIRSGVIGEQGTYSSHITDREAEVFRASARAAIETGAAISTHTHAGELALDQLHLLASMGLPLDRVIVGHLDDRSPLDIDLHREVAKRGAWVQFDDIGFDYFSETLNVQMPSDEQRLNCLKQLVEDGYADRIVLGSDVCKTSHLRANGGPGFRHLVGPFRELAKNAGFTDSLLDQLLTKNPARALAFA